MSSYLPVPVLLAALAGCATMPEDRSADFEPERAAVMAAAKLEGAQHKACTDIPVYVVDQAELNDLCEVGGQIDGCYSPNSFIALLDVEDPYGRAQIAAHEYGHCIATRTNHDAVFCSVVNRAWHLRHGDLEPPRGRYKGCI